MSKDNLLKSGILKTLKSLLFALIVALFIRYIFIQPFKIPSKSMYPTLMVGDHLLVDRLSYGFALPCSDTIILVNSSEFFFNYFFEFKHDSRSLKWRSI